MTVPRIHGLTAKQWVILRYVAEGMKNREVAQMIGNTELATKNYLRTIYDILGVWNRIELTLWYLARTSKRGRVILVLKPREMQVCRLLLAGCTTDEIAQAIHSSRRTVKAYLHRLFVHFVITSGIKRVKLIVLLYPLFHKESHETPTDAYPVPLPLVAGRTTFSHSTRLHGHDAGSAI